MKLIGKFLFLVLISFLLAAHGQAQGQSPTRPPPTTCVDGVTTEFRGFSTGVAPFVYDERNPTCIPGYSGELDDVGAISQMITHTVECPDGRNDCLVLSRNIEDYFNGEVRRDALEVRNFFNGLKIHSTSYTAVIATLVITGIYKGTVEGGPTVEKTNIDRYRLTLKDGLPVLYDDSAIRKGDVLGFSPFSSLVVTHDPDEVDTRGRKEATTIRRVVIEFECSGEGHKDCLILKDASTSGATVKAKGEPLKVEWDIGGTAAQAQSSLRDLVVEWRADYNEPREATARVFLETSVRNIFGDVLMRNTIPFEYRLSFRIPDGGSLVLYASSTEQAVFRAGKRVFSAIRVSSPITVTGNGESVEELITSVRITQQCEPSCARLGLLPDASSMGFVITPGRYTTATEVNQYFLSTQGVSFSSVRALLSSNVAIASTSEKVLRVTLAVTVGSDLRGLNRLSNTLEYSLTFNGEPTVESTNREDLNVLRSFPFSSATVMDDPREADEVAADPREVDTIRSVVIEFECSGGRKTCVDVKDVSQTGGATVDVKSTGLEAVWDAGRTATQVQSFLQALGVAWNADYITPRVATARISLKTRVRNVLGDIAKHDTTPREYRLSFRIPDGGSLVLYASSTEQAVFRAGKRVFSAIRVSSPITVTGNGESVEELITSVRITQQCEPSCARLGLLPDASSMGFVITPGRYTTATEVNQYFLSTQGVSFSSVRALLSSNVAIASTSEKVLRVTLAVTVGSDLRGLNRLSNTLEYSLTFNGEPTVESTNREDLNVLRSFPFSSATVMDDPREADEVAADPREVDTIRSVVIEFECSGGRKTCVDVKDVSQTGGATVDVKSTGLEAVWDAGRTATQVQSFLQALGVAWNADYITPRVATARISLKTRVRNVLGDIAKHDTTPREYRLSFRIPDGGSLVLYASSTEQAVFRPGKGVFSAIRVSSPLTVTGNGESVEELITSVRITQQCKPSCARLGLLPDASSMGFVITPGRYTTATEVDQYFLSTQGVSFSSVRALLSSNVAMASTSENVLRVTLAVTVGSDLRGLNRLSNTLEYSLTFNGEPTVESTNRENLNVLRSFPFSSATVMDDPREADEVAADPREVDTIRSVVIEFECSGGRKTCVDVKDVSQTGGATVDVKSTGLEAVWDAGRTAAQVQSFLQALGVAWSADYISPRVATARISLNTRVRNILGDIAKHDTTPREYRLSFRIPDGGPLVLYDPSTEQAVFRPGKRVFSAIRVSSPITVTGNGESVEELITSVRITQLCEPSCARLGLLPDASSMGFVITPGRYTTATEVNQYFLSTQGVSFSSVRALLSSNVAMASTSEKVLSVTLTVTVGSDLRGLGRSSAGLVYFLTFNGEPTVEATNRENLNVLRSFPFSSATVMDDPREPDEVAADPGEVDTIRSVVIEFECSGGRKTCVDVKDASQTGGATVDVKSTGLEAVWDAGRTAAQVQSFLQALGVAWSADYITPRVATARISLKTRVRNVLGDIAKHDTTPREYRLSFRIPDGGSLVLDDPSTEQAVFRAGKRVFSAIRVSSPITVTGNGESVEELITSVRITQLCEPSCARLGLLPDASSMGFVITPGRYTTATEVDQYFLSTQGVTFSRVQALLSSNVAIASTSEKVLRVTLTVTVGSDLRGLNRLSNTLEYSLTFNGEPTVEATNRENLNVLRSFPFSSATVMDDPREPDEVAADPREVDTIRSVVIEFECSGGRKTCVDVKDVSQTGGATVDVKSTGLEAVWDAGRTATQVQSFLQALGVAWSADYISPRVATARISLKTRVRNILGDIAKHDTTPREYRLSFRIPDGGPLVLDDPSTEQAVFRAGKRVFSAIRVSSPITVTGNGESVEELITSVRITQQCEPSCARLGLLPDASSMGFVITPGRYTTATEVVQYILSTQGVSFSSVRALLSSNVAMASTSEKVLRVTLAVTVGSDLRGLNRLSNTLEYSLTFNGEPTVESTNREDLNVLRSFPFSSATVMDDPREADEVAADPREVDTIRSVVIEFECSGGRKTCVDVKDVSQTGGATVDVKSTGLEAVWDAGRTATQVQSFLQALGVAWNADYITPRVATARISLKTRVRNVLGDIAKHDTTPREYRLSFRIPDGGSLVLYASSTEQAVFRAGKRVFSAIRVSSPITVTGNGESVEELITSVRITQQCEPSCARLGLLPDASSMGFVITPGRYTTATEVNQYFLSTQGVSFSRVQALLSNNIAMASTSNKVLSVTLTVTVGSDLRGLGRSSAGLVYFLTFNGVPKLADDLTSREGNVLGFSPFRSIRVTDDPREADQVAADPGEVDTIRSVAIEFECSDRTTCVDVNDVSQTTVLKEEWDAGRTATQVQSSLRGLVVGWGADYKEPREATARISLRTSVRNIFGSAVTHSTEPLEYSLSFNLSDGHSILSDGEPLVLYDPNTEQTVFRAGKKVFSAIIISSPIIVTGNGKSVEELVTSVRITQQCKPSCARLGLLPNASSMGFVITPGRYTTATEVDQYFLSTQGVTFSSIRALLSSNIAMASTSEKVLSVTLTVTVESDLRGLNRLSNTLEYSLTFNGAPTLSDVDTSRGGYVLGFSPFSSITVTDDPGEVDTIRSVVIEFECSRGRAACVDVKGVSRTGGATVQVQSTALKVVWDAGETAKQVQSSLRGFVTVWGADYKEQRKATARVVLGTSVRNILGDDVRHSTEPLEYSLSFNLSSDLPRLDDPNTEKTGPAVGFLPLSAITIIGEAIEGVPETISDINGTLKCVNRATTCASFVGVEPGDFSGTTLGDAEMFLRGLQVRSRFASYEAKLTVSVVTSLNGLERPSNELTYTLTFPTPGSTRDRLIAPAFAVDLKVVNPYLDMINPENLAAVKEAVVGHCIGDYFEDSDDDGVPNNVEAQLGTDCLNRDRNSGFNNVAGDKGRPYVRVVGELVLDQLPFIGNLDKLPLTDSSGDPGIECQTCVEVLFLEIQSECTSASSDSVVGNGNISFPGVNVSSCYLVGRFSSSPTGSENSTLYGTLFPRPGWSGLYVLGIDKYGNWSVDGDGVLETLMVYTPPVLSLGPDVYSITDKANIGVELRGRRTPPSVVYTPTAPGFTLFGDTRESGSFGTYWERDHRTVLVDVSSPRLVTLVATDIFDRSPPYFVMGRSTLTVIQDSPPSFISIGLQKDGRSAAVISLEDDANSYSLNVSGGAQSTVTIVDGEVMVMEGEEVMVLEDVGDLLDRVRGTFDSVATLKVRVSSTDNTVEAQFPVFSSTKTAANAAAWTRAVVNRDIVVTSCLTDLCAPDNPFAYASVNLGPGAYLSHVIASSLRDFPVSFDKVRETLNEFVSGELSLDPDLNGTELLTDVISYSGAASNVSETTASFVFDLRHKPFTKDGRLVKRILVDGEYKWRGVANLDEDGSVWYTTKRDSTCPSSDDDSAWSDTDNGFIPASASTPVRCVRLDIVDGGLYANGSNGYYSGSIFGAGADAFPLAHVGGGRAYDSYDTWLIVFVVLAALLYSGSAGVWTILTLLMVIALSVWRRRRVAVHSEL